MGELRRQELKLLFTAVLAMMACTEGSGEGSVVPKIVLRNLSAPGAFSVTNNGPDIELQRRVVVEKMEPAGWRATYADVRLIATCEEKETGTTRLMKHGETLVVKSWNGWSCNGQCPRSCRANIFLGPGQFRFVVVSGNSTQRFEGEAFTLAEKP
jgi:hypothetical protein